MRNKFLLFLLTVTVFSSCQKEQQVSIQPPDPPSGEQLKVQTALKDITIPGLPSPYYHFEYDTAGKVSLISFASGFGIYNVIYSGNKILELRNTGAANRDTLKYMYDNEGRVKMITYTDLFGEVYVKVHLRYDRNKLINLERERKSGAVFFVNKTLSMSYYADGNLKELKYHLPVTPINLKEITYTDRFEQYDDKINSDGFSLLHHEFFDDLVFLPGIQLQENNPGKEIRTGEATNHEINYSYTYNDRNMPLSKTGDMTILSGPAGGEKFQTNSVYTYY